MERIVFSESGEKLIVPEDWDLLHPGDGPLTKLVKAKGPTWVVKVKKGRRLISKGVWADSRDIEAAKTEIAAKRNAPGYARKQEMAVVRRNKKQQEYVTSFQAMVLAFLDFHPRYEQYAVDLSLAVTQLATPVGSGTVARTERIPVAERASSAVIAWMRHETTRYDRMSIARIKGERRRVRRELATSSVELLTAYRKGVAIPDSCPLKRALDRIKA